MHRALRGDTPRLGHHSGTSVDAAHPYLNIHSASYTGNFGLVSYALTSGVPHSAVLDGITPLHAACAGQANNEAVVNVLIEHGADVNAARGTSRRASAENNRSPRVGGAIGYTPLHYAVSAGQMNIVPILLAAGADPSIPDKHGILPHHLAKQAGRGDIETMLLDAFMQRASTSTSGGSGTIPMPPSPRPAEKESKRLGMKKSLESILYPSRHMSSDAGKASTQGLATPPGGVSPFTTDGPGSGYGSAFPAGSGGTRRPSVPSIQSQLQQQHLPPSPPRLPPSPSGSHSPRKDKRPRSAGASNDPSHPSSSGSTAQSLSKKLGTKYSLLNVLKRNTDDQPPADTHTRGSGTLPPTPPHYLSYSQHWYPQTPVTQERKSSFSPSPSSPDSSAGAPTPAPSTSPTMPRPGILRTPLQHRRSSSNSLGGMNGASSPGSSTEVSRKASTRTLRFEDPAPSPSISVNGGSWSTLSAGSGGTRKTSDASERSGVIVRRPSDHSLIGSMSGMVEEEGAEATSLQRLALANSNRARAGTFGTGNSTPSGTPGTPGTPSQGVDIPSPLPSSGAPGSRGSPISGSPGYEMHGSTSGSPSPSARSRIPVGVGVEGDPDVPDYSSDLSDEEQEAEPPEVPSKDTVPLPLRTGSVQVPGVPSKVVSRKSSGVAGYPTYHSSTVTEEDDQAQYARYDMDGEFEEYEEAEPAEKPRRIWSSPSYTYGYGTTPFSAPPPGAGGMGMVFTTSPPASGSITSPSATFSSVATPTPTSTSTSAATSAHSPTFSIRSHREARHLVQQVQREILASAQVGARNLSEQLAAYGETLAIERRFAIGERQRWKNAGMEEDEEGVRISSGVSSGGGGHSLKGEGEEDDDDDPGGVSMDDGEGGEEVREMKRRASLRMRERERGEREQQILGHVSSYGNLNRTKAPVRPTLKPLISRRPHSSSGVTTQGNEGGPVPSSSGHRSTRSATAPIVPSGAHSHSNSHTETGLGIEIVKTVPTPQGSGSPSSQLSIDPRNNSGSYIQGHSFSPSSPLRRSLGENGDLEEDSPESGASYRSRRHRHQHQHQHTFSSGSAQSGYTIIDTLSSPMSVNSSSTLPQLSPVLSESSSTTFTYPKKRKSKTLPISTSIVAVGSTHSQGPPSAYPPVPPSPRDPPMTTPTSASTHDFHPKLSRVSTASDRSAGSSDSLGLKGLKSEKRRFPGLKMFVQTIRGGRA